MGFDVTFNNLPHAPAICIKDSTATRKRAQETVGELNKFFEIATSIDASSKVRLQTFMNIFERCVIAHIHRNYTWIGCLIIAFQRYTYCGTLGSLGANREKLQRLPLDERVQCVVQPLLGSQNVHQTNALLPEGLEPMIKQLRRDPTRAVITFATEFYTSFDREVVFEQLQEHVSAGKISRDAYTIFKVDYDFITAFLSEDIDSFCAHALKISGWHLDALRTALNRRFPEKKQILEAYYSFLQVARELREGNEAYAKIILVEDSDNVNYYLQILAALKRERTYADFARKTEPLLYALKMIQQPSWEERWDLFHTYFPWQTFQEMRLLLASVKGCLKSGNELKDIAESMSESFRVLRDFEWVVYSADGDTLKIQRHISSCKEDERFICIQYVRHNNTRLSLTVRQAIFKTLIEFVENRLHEFYDHKAFADLSEEDDDRNIETDKILFFQADAHRQQKMLLSALRECMVHLTEQEYQDFLVELVPHSAELRAKYDLLIRFDVDPSHLQKGVVRVQIGSKGDKCRDLTADIRAAGASLKDLRTLFIEANFTGEELERRFQTDFTESGARNRLKDIIEQDTHKKIQNERVRKGLPQLSEKALKAEYARLMPAQKLKNEVDSRMSEYFRRGFILEAIDRFIKNLKKKERIALMPQGVHGSQWCLEMELGLVKIFEKLQGASKETLKECLSDIICSIGHCAVGIEAAVIRRYRELVLQLPPTADEDIYQDLADFRSILAESVLSPPGEESAMFYAKFGFHLGKEFGLPGNERFQKSRADEFAPGGAIDIERERVRAHGVYHAAAIVGHLTPNIHAMISLKNYCYASIPPGWRRPFGLEYEAMKAQIQSWMAAKVAADTIVKDLQREEYDLWIQKSDLANIDGALTQARKSEYMASVTKDNKITQVGVTNMLQNMQVLRVAVRFRT